MAVSSDTTIANLALSAIGTRSTIASLTENSAEAQTINLHYTNVRDELLREAHWNFARKQASLALLNDSTQASPAVTATATFSSGATSLTVTNSVGILAAATVSGTGIASGTTVVSVSGGTVTLSAATTSAQTSISVVFTPTTYQVVPLPWRYEYAYPGDCIQVREILPLLPTQQINQSIFGLANNGAVNNFGSLNRTPVIKYLISADTINGQTATVILTNQPNAVLVYTYEVTNPAFFDPSFVYALAGRLAARISIALNGDKALTAMALKSSEEIINKAKARDGNEGVAMAGGVPDWIRSRGFTWDSQSGGSPWGGDNVTTGFVN